MSILYLVHIISYLLKSLFTDTVTLVSIILCSIYIYRAKDNIKQSIIRQKSRYNSIYNFVQIIDLKRALNSVVVVLRSIDI